MSSWRDQILKEFIPKVARLTLVADRDGLLLEEGILEGVHERGFELIPFEDHLAFRYAYESKFRSRWDRGEHTDLVVILRSQANDLSGLPYDLLQAGRKLSFNLGDLFPNLSYPVVTALDRGDLEALYEAQKRHAPGQLGDNATKEFVLRHVFEIAPELVKQPSDLLRVLLRRHYHGQRIPADLDNRFIQLLRQSNVFDDWPLETLVSDREAFFAFLQERWPIFLDREAAKGTSGIREEKKPYGLSIEGPVELPFDHHDLRVYLDNLFVEGVLHSVPHKHADTLSKTWVGLGIRTAPMEDKSRRLGKLLDGLEVSIPAEDAKHTDWFHFARSWAETILLANDQAEAIPEATDERIKGLQAQVDAGFVAWLFKRYAGLINLPPVPPVMLHHLPRFLARQVGENRHAKIALILVDGLALDQWLVVRSALAFKQPGMKFREQAVFAWIPSLTSVSRQAAFAGKAPIFFPNSIQTTDKEPALWTQFWADHGLTPNEVVYLKGLGDGSLETVSEALSHPKARVVGLVVDKVDKIMHGMEMGTAGMHNQVRQWAQQPFMNTLLELLLDRGFRVYLTSDHGNVETKGCGRPAEGAMADLRGERVRVYPDAALRAKVKERFPAALEWGPVGLPEDYLALLAPARKAFVQETQRTVSHGGASLEELIVPLVQIERRGE
ncbi:MAG: alkaline phosphatase [Deltaproteobacteria bacterium RIFOXYA12_FULL_61_11]|nr:MAG: alkaline phosphatase [Deltaproteobacteria bacterium RIFOXYA12_FULL_61_11]